ncbi:MAG: MFS transporter [Dokdonella sp.]|uniref:NTP/NDP exchange transporter n=1 Tax=Dokdonella sp. TaxID=2291710 RepID=UPI0025C3A2F8|nr:MFS transporter [Dokdonella sp.]MBX3700990.1 MFS transporter [Dokdonella sp.]
MPRTPAIQRHEWFAVAVAFVYFFCVLAAYYVLRPVRDQLSAAVGSTGLPIFYLATFIATLLLAPPFGALVARFPRRVFVPATYLFFMLGTIAFIPLFQLQDAIGARLLGSVFFVWISVFNLFVVAVFWSFMADLFDAEQAHRLFPIVALGGAIGAIAGPLLTKTLNELVGVSGLLVVSAVLLGLGVACMFALSRWSQRHPVAGDERREQRIIGGGFLAGALETIKSPVMRRMALLMLLGDAVGTVIYAFLADYNGAVNATREARIEFQANIDLATNVLQMLLQVGVTRTLMVRLGPQFPLALDGVVKAVMLALFAIFGGPWIAAVAVLTRASAYGIFKPAADSLYTRVDAETRYKTKNFIDTSVWRFGDVVVTSGFNGLRALGAGIGLTALVTVLAALASARVGWTAAHLLERARAQPRE